MKIAKALLAAAALALAGGLAYGAKDDDKDRQGFNDMDKNADGKLTRAEAAGKKDLLGKWKVADKNNDGVLTRAEYLAVMAKKDASMVKEKVTKEVQEARRRAPGGDQPAAAGATTKKPQ